MRALKLIGIGLVPAVLICAVSWLGGWNFERGPWGAMVGAMSIFGGWLAACYASEVI